MSFLTDQNNSGHGLGGHICKSLSGYRKARELLKTGIFYRSATTHEEITEHTCERFLSIRSVYEHVCEGSYPD